MYNNGVGRVSDHDSPDENEEDLRYHTKRQRQGAEIQALLARGVVHHESDWVRRDMPRSAPCKRKEDVVVRVTTVGYAPLQAG